MAQQEHDPAFEKKVRRLLRIDIPQMLDGGTNFTSVLMRLIGKSDPGNKHKLKTVYPAEVEAVRRFQAGITEGDNSD